MDGPLRVCLMGASTDTGNEGVTALCRSVLRGLFEREPRADVTVFDNGLGTGTLGVSLGGQRFTYKRAGIRRSRRIYLQESLFRVCLASRFGVPNPVADALRSADAAIDITGGDSFTDLYGRGRFRAGSVAKRLALRLSGGLIFLPQTYGPFKADSTRREAAAILRSAAAAWARDAQSYATLRELLGESFDSARHRSGVDVAFRLAPEQPSGPSLDALRAWVGGDERPTVGINVSGLVYNQPQSAQQAYGLVCDYRAVVHGIVTEIVATDRARVILIPHVHARHGDYEFESDRGACEALRAALPESMRESVTVAPDLGAAEAKWVIARTDWFCGTRMHTAIAALSSGVPCAALAYSLKTRGVFETCGQGEHVADLRALDTPSAIGVILRSWRSRREAHTRLTELLPTTLAAADRQMDEIVATCRRLAASRRRRGAPATA